MYMPTAVPSLRRTTWRTAEGFSKCGAQAPSGAVSVVQPGTSIVPSDTAACAVRMSAAIRARGHSAVTTSTAAKTGQPVAIAPRANASPGTAGSTADDDPGAIAAALPTAAGSSRHFAPTQNMSSITRPKNAQP